MTSQISPEEAEKESLEASIHRVEVYNDEQSAQTFADKLKKLQEFHNDTLKRNDSTYYGTYPKNRAKGRVKNLQKRYPSRSQRSLSKMFINNDGNYNINSDGPTLAKTRSFKKNSKRIVSAPPEDDFSLGEPCIEASTSSTRENLLRPPPEIKFEGDSTFDHHTLGTNTKRGSELFPRVASSVSSGYGTLVNRDSKMGGFSSSNLIPRNTGTSTGSTSAMTSLEPIEHCEAEVIIDRPPIRTRNTTTGAPSFATHQRMSTKSWRPSSARNDTNTPMGQHYTLGAAAPKPYNGEKDSYLDVVARGSVDLDLQTETGIISSLEYDEFDDSLQDFRSDTRSQTMLGGPSFRHADTLLSNDSSGLLFNSENRRLHSKTMQDVNAAADDEEERDLHRADTLRTWHQNAQMFESFNKKRQQDINEKIERYKRNIICAAEEIVQTEKSYNQRIRLMGPTLRKEAEQDQKVADYFKKGKQCIDVLREIVAKFEEMTVLSDRMLLEFEQTWNPPTDVRVSNALVKVALFLKVYNDYVSGYEAISANLMQVIEKNMKVRDFMESFIRRHINKGTILDIKSLMMEPVQRIPRYQLLLREYKKHQEKYIEFCKEQYEDYDDTLKALEFTQEVAANANAAILLQERQNSMDDLVKKVSGIELEELVTPDRKLIKQELLLKANRSNYEMRLFVLFSDVLMYFVVLSENHSYLFKQKLDLAYLKVETHKNKEDRELVIRSKDKSLTVICKDTHQQTDWYEAIEKTVEEHKKRLISIGKLQQGVSSLGHTAPVWIRDDTVSACQIPGCDRKFTWRRRYHHCRACGKAICSRCSETAYVPYKHKRDRVCLICYDELEKCPVGNRKYQRYLKEGDIYSVAAEEGDIAGFLEALSGGTWKTSVYSLRRCVLYEYIQRNDIRAISTRPLISWRVSRLTCDVNHRPAEFCFKLEHQNMEDIIFRANSREDRENWVALLEEHVLGVPLEITCSDILKKLLAQDGKSSISTEK